MAKARQAICERGQKLSEVEDRTEMMANEAKVIRIFFLLGVKFRFACPDPRGFDQVAGSELNHSDPDPNPTLK